MGDNLIQTVVNKFTCDESSEDKTLSNGVEASVAGNGAQCGATWSDEVSIQDVMKMVPLVIGPDEEGLYCDDVRGMIVQVLRDNDRPEDWTQEGRDITQKYCEEKWSREAEETKKVEDELKRLKMKNQAKKTS